MVTTIDQKIDALGSLNCKLAFIVGKNQAVREYLLERIIEKRRVSALNISWLLSEALSQLTAAERPLAAAAQLKELAAAYERSNLILMHRIEVLFDQSLRLDPVLTLRRLADRRRIVAIWPGEYDGHKLMYAELGHPEYRRSQPDSIVILDAQQKEQL